MAKESPFVEVAQAIAEKIFCHPAHVVRGKPLLYEITVNNFLEIMSPEQVKKPKRGTSAFQTDLCILEEKLPGITIPRVVLEFKTKITTHDILTYSAKAAKHKKIYPYLRYGIVASSEAKVPGRFFTHNESLDFFAAVAGLEGIELERFFNALLTAEMQASEDLESMAFGKTEVRLYRK